ncbi:N-acetylglucosamine-6-phosphate deacetylase [Sphingomonas sp. NFR15]|uniref:N-acetylglucosamine-6-phosphate deacetylase n=1 Tax=Sphingomonas sp. NFR15 TaxID=1566282 RepID=UPI000885E00D|nr:N-acetylglucosamine-6-phosphate deacetylase [Sphingomonas sp. NFR15]SDA22444.1 N-acetylglucosamine-6-phosphate deacetylase [Sphingomonas sp. NFR15]
MSTITIHGGHILVGDAILSDATFVLADGRLRAVEPAGAGDIEIDLASGWLLPGFIDTQVNGGGGVLFNNALTIDGLATIAAAHARFGTTALLPTLISDTHAAIGAALDAVDAAILAGVPGIVGVHIEGPFISGARKGIHDPSLIRALDREVIEALCAPRRGVVMMTLAPEIVTAQDVSRLAAAGVILSAGHTDATYEQARAGFAAGITGVTHLYNAMSPLLHRAPGVVGAAFTDDRIWCGLIADGVHVAPAALDVALRVKGADRLMLVTDAMPSVGSGDDSFLLNGRRMVVRDGVCQGDDGTLAGAHLDMAQAVRTMRAATGADLPLVSRMASASPAAFLGLDRERGTLAPGKRADFVVLDADLQPLQTWIGGVKVAAEPVDAHAQGELTGR